MRDSSPKKAIKFKIISQTCKNQCVSKLPLVTSFRAMFMKRFNPTYKKKTQ